MADVCLWVWAGKRVEGGTTRQIRGGLIPGRSAFRCETRVHETCAHRSHFEKEVPWGVKVMHEEHAHSFSCLGMCKACNDASIALSFFMSKHAMMQA
eukprot:1158512-Pelagomonas_calceolata.AAC.7